MDILNGCGAALGVSGASFHPRLTRLRQFGGVTRAIPMSAHLADRLPAPGLPNPSLLHRDRFLTFAFAAADLLLEASVDGTIRFAAGAFQARFGLRTDEVTGQALHSLFAPADRMALDLALSATALRGRLPPVILRLADAGATPVIVSGLAMPGAGNPVFLTVGRLPALPAPDGPAGPSFTALAQERLSAGQGGALSLLELTDWLHTQDRMPPDAAAALQLEVEDALARMGGPGSVTGVLGSGRYGLLSDTAPDLEAVAAELEALLSAHPDALGTTVQSAGLALDTAGLTGPQAARALRFALARFADGGAQAAKDAGFAGGLASFIAGAQLRARTVRSALAEGRFRLAYQPVVTLGSREVHHFEALLRPSFAPGSIIQTTQDFVTFAEAVGLSEELDWAVLQRAVAAAADHPGVRIAVNVSGLSMQSAAFRERALRLLRDGPAQGRMLIELTETSDISDVAAAAETIASLRGADVPVCIDDFGAGSAAFRYLREFRVDFVKLDGAYVRGALQNAREHGFLLAMVELANFVGARLIAETIETDAEAAMMQDLGVEYGQGWLFGKPGDLPAPG